MGENDYICKRLMIQVVLLVHHIYGNGTGFLLHIQLCSLTVSGTQRLEYKDILYTEALNDVRVHSLGAGNSCRALNITHTIALALSANPEHSQALRTESAALMHLYTGRIGSIIMSEQERAQTLCTIGWSLPQCTFQREQGHKY